MAAVEHCAIRRLADLPSAGELPSPGPVALKLVELASRDDVSAGELARILQADPALAGRVIKLANSAALGGRGIVSIIDAVMRVGFRGVRQLAVGLSLLTRCKTGPCPRFDYRAFWTRSLASAIAGEQLSHQHRLAAADDCFTLGLLHDIGSLGLATKFPQEYAHVLSEHGHASEDERCEAERSTFGLCHRELGGLMLLDWGVPAVFVKALRLEAPGQVPSARDDALGAFFDAAIALGRWFAMAPDVERRLPLELVARHEVFLQEPEDLLCAVQGAWGDWSDELGLQPSRPPFARRVTAAPAVRTGAARDTMGRPRALLVGGLDGAERMLAERLLGELGFETRRAPGGLEALEQLGAHRFDLVLADLAMAELDGIALCRSLRSMPENKATHVVLLANEQDHDRLLDALAAGANEFLPQPVEAAELRARIVAAQRVIALQMQLDEEATSLRVANAQLEAANQQLAAISLIDPLTGLPNRRHLLDRLQQEWHAAARRRSSFAVVYADLDHFKRINDERGHDAGDVVLERVARVLHRCVRQMDTVGRFGGEEFLAICPGADGEAAVAIAERIRSELAREDIRFRGKPVAVTASLGVAHVHHARSNQGWDALVKLADSALYRAKHAGRNRVFVEECADA